MGILGRKPSEKRPLQFNDVEAWRAASGPAACGNGSARSGDAARALRFLILTAVRKGAVIEATWEEFDLDLGC